MFKDAVKKLVSEYRNDLLELVNNDASTRWLKIDAEVGRISKEHKISKADVVREIGRLLKKDVEKFYRSYKSQTYKARICINGIKEKTTVNSIDKVVKIKRALSKLSNSELKDIYNYIEGLL